MGTNLLKAQLELFALGCVKQTTQAFTLAHETIQSLSGHVKDIQHQLN